MTKILKLLREATPAKIGERRPYGDGPVSVLESFEEEQHGHFRDAEVYRITVEIGAQYMFDPTVEGIQTSRLHEMVRRDLILAIADHLYGEITSELRALTLVIHQRVHDYEVTMELLERVRAVQTLMDPRGDG